MSPWVETTLEELRNRPWPPPDGKWHYRTAQPIGITVEARETRLKDGRFLRMVEVKVAGVVLHSADTRDDTETMEATTERAIQGFAKALQRALEDDE